MAALKRNYSISTFNARWMVVLFSALWLTSSATESSQGTFGLAASPPTQSAKKSIKYHPKNTPYFSLDDGKFLSNFSLVSNSKFKILSFSPFLANYAFSISHFLTF